MSTIPGILRAKRGGLLSVPPTATVLDALQLMADHNVGALVVMDGDQLVGIFSERDYARKVVLVGKMSRDTPVAEIMTSAVTTVRPDQSVEACMALMSTRHIRHLPVVVENRVIGIISIGDVVQAEINDQKFMIEQLEQYEHG